MLWKWMRRLLPSPTPRLEDNVPIWSIQARDAGTFFVIVALLWLVALLRVGYNAMERAAAPLSGGHGLDLAMAVLGEFGYVGIGAAMVAMLLTRLVNMMGEAAMTFYQAMVNRFVIPVIEKHRAEGREQGLQRGLEQGLEQGREQGLEQGQLRGKTEAHEEWLAWNRRRVEAEQGNRPFDESPPSG